MISEDEYAASNIDVFVTHTSVNPDVSLDELCAFLKTKRANGEIRIQLHLGGKRQITLTETTKLQASDREIIRKILKMA